MQKKKLVKNLFFELVEKISSNKKIVLDKLE